MVDAVTAVGTIGTIATAMMVVGMLYLVFLGLRSGREYGRTEAEPEAGAESARVEGQ